MDEKDKKFCLDIITGKLNQIDQRFTGNIVPKINFREGAMTSINFNQEEVILKPKQ